MSPKSSLSFALRSRLAGAFVTVFTFFGASHLDAATLLTESFNVGSTTQSNTLFWWANNSNEANKPTAAQLDYWKPSNDGTSLGMGVNGNPSFNNAFINQRGNTDVTKQVWWLRDLRDGPSAYNSTRGTIATGLASNQIFSNASFSGTAYYTNNNSSAIAVTYSLALLNQAGNGYVATISTTNGVVSFYQLDHGISGSWGTALASSTATVGANLNAVTFTFGVSSGTLSLTSTAGLSLSTADATYGEFTSIGFAALMENTQSPYVRLRAVTLKGDMQTAAVPEPASWGVITACVVLATVGLRRRRARACVLA